MGRHLIYVGLLWAGLTAIGESLVFLDMFPVVGSEQAKDFDDIFRFLLIMGLPVFFFAVAVVAYSVVAFRSADITATGPAMFGRGKAPIIWLVVTGGLAIAVMIHPGLTGLAALQDTKTGYGWGDTDAEMTVHVTGFQWAWEFEYEGSGVKLGPGVGKELVVPVDTTIKFAINRGT